MKTILIFVFLTLLTIKVNSRSLTIVIDTTISMQEEIDILRRDFVTVVNGLKNSSELKEFIFVPFNDHDAGIPLKFQRPATLVDVLNSLTVNGGHECPENSLAGIQKGLEVSGPESLIFVFTDAYAKDAHKLGNIESLCRDTRSQVVIFLSGNCPQSDTEPQGSLDVYNDITRTCSGSLFRFDLFTLKSAFKYMREMVNTDWNDVTSHQPFIGYKQFSFSVDKFTSDFLVAASGEYPALRITDTEGNTPVIQNIIDTRRSLVVRLTNLHPGTYLASVSGQGMNTLTFYKKTQIPFSYGFSPRRPHSLKETSLRPLPGRVNYIVIFLPPTYHIRITSVELRSADGHDKKSLDVEEGETQGYYYASVFMEQGKAFRCTIHGKDSNTYEDIRSSTRLVEVQEIVQQTRWAKPVVEVIQPDNNLIDFGAQATFACKVKGYPKPSIWWEEASGINEEILLEMPSTYINYITFNVTTNATIYCKAKNAEGTDEQSLEIFVRRNFTFGVVQTPSDETFEYGSEGKLFCEVNAYPEAEIKWYHNHTSIETSPNIEINDNILLIKKMNLSDIGTYTCEASNGVTTESFDAEVLISGLEAPQLEVNKSEIVLKPGDWINIECRVTKGNPWPEISWSYLIDDFESTMPSDVYVEDDKLKISAVKIEHKGTYRCMAKNIMGTDAKEVIVLIQYAPKITNTEEGTIEVTEGDKVELKCDVDAIPEATVRWELTQDDVIVTLDDRHTTNDAHTHKFYALWKDSGTYHCIAENIIGKLEKSVTVNVLVAPYIQPPVSRMMDVKAGADVKLDCNVLYGNPAPEIIWEFISLDSTTTVLSRGNSSHSHLELKNVTKANEGLYLCIADNRVANDRIRINLRVQ